MVQRMTGYWWLKSQNKYRNESIYFYSHRHYYRTYRAVYQYSTHKRFEMNKTFIIFVMMILFLAIASYATLPRGIRNKNPGNIKRNNTQWQGMQLIQNDPEFVQFKHPKYGFRAMARILRTYQNQGLNTIRQIINRYAPNSENDTQAYTDFIAKQLNISPDQMIKLENHMQPLIKAITAFEQGRLFASLYDDQTISEGIALS